MCLLLRRAADGSSAVNSAPPGNPAGLVLDPVASAPPGNPPGLVLDPVKPDGIFEAKSAGFGDQVELAAKLLFTMEPAAQRDIIASVLPDAKFSEDSSGNVIIDYNGEVGYLNPPGINLRDVNDFSASVLKFLPAAKMATLFKGLLGRAIVGGSAAALTSVGEDKAAQLVGSEQPVSAGKAVTAGVTGAAAEAIVPLFGAIARSKPGQVVAENAKAAMDWLRGRNLVLDGALTAEGIAAIRSMGFDPSSISAKLGLSAAKIADDAIDPKAAQVVAEAESFGVPVTRGQATQENAQLALEENVRSADVVPGGAGDRLRQFDDRQNAALIGEGGETGAGLVQAEIGGGSQSLTATSGRSAAADVGEKLAQAGDEVVSSIPALAKAEQAAYREAYEAAAMGDVLFQPEAVRSGIINVRKQMREAGLDRSLDVHAQTPQSARVDAQLARLNRFLRPREGKKLRPVDLRMVERERRRINFAISAAKSAEDKRVLMVAKNALDGWLDSAVEKALISGDPAAIETLKKARNLYAIYQKKYGGKDAVGKIVQRLEQGDVSGTDAINLIFGAGQIGSKQTTVKTLERLKSIFGEDSAQMRMLGEALWLRILQRSVKRDSFNVGQFLTAYDDAFSGKGREVMRVMFTDDQVKRLDEFRRLVGRLEKPKNVGNPSKSATVFAQMLQQFLPRIGAAVDVTGAMPGAGTVIATLSRRAGNKLDFSIPRADQPVALPRAAGVAGVTQANDRE